MNNIRITEAARFLRRLIENGSPSTVVEEQTFVLVAELGGNIHLLPSMTPEGRLLYVISLVLTQ